MLLSVNPRDVVAQQRSFFQSGKTKSLEFRRDALRRLQEAIAAREAEIIAALQEDLRKPTFEAIGTEIAYCKEEIAYALKGLHRWTKPKRVSTPLNLQPATSRIVPEPLGVVLIIAPWNYPFQLAMIPLIGAIAAGNCAIVKPSEITAATSKIVAQLINSTFAPEYICAVEGDKEITQGLLAQQFDHIFFTGSTSVGKIVMQAAAQQLTPVTLELGGKSPCIVDSEIQVEYSARRLLWGKFINAGQTCIAPDYLLVKSEIKDALLAAMQRVLREYYGENPESSPDYARIVSDRHFQRLCGLLEQGKILVGGETNPKERYIAPTILTEVSWDDPVMQEEIFGPILPVLEYQDLGEAIAAINARPKPLALYIFSRNQEVQQRVLQETSAGGVTINDTIIHIVSTELPFGGVGESGIGAYHGKASFDTFSHQKAVTEKSFLFDIKLRYPPYAGKLKWLNLLFR